MSVEFGEWHVACGMFHVACKMWHVACGMWHVACGMRHVTCGKWKVEAGRWNVLMWNGMWNVECGMLYVKAPASSFLMSVVIAGHTLHTAKNLHPSYHSQLHSCSIPSRRWNKPRWRLQMQSCNDPGVCSNGWARNEYCAYIVENVLPSHHSQFYSHSLPCSMAPILCSIHRVWNVEVEC